MRHHFLSFLFILITAFCFACGNSNKSENSGRQKENFDFDWRFSRGDFPEASQPNFDDSEWKEIDVPHDWAILDEFSPDNPTGRPGGFHLEGWDGIEKPFS